MKSLPFYAERVITMLESLGSVKSLSRRTTKKVEITKVTLATKGGRVSATIREGRILGFNLGLFEVRIGRNIAFTELEALGEFVYEAAANY